MRFVGIDPGFFGAIAILEDSNPPKLFPMPLIKAGKKGKHELDIPGLVEVFRVIVTGPPVKIALEKAQALPPSIGASKASMFRFGRVMGMLEGMTVMCGIPYQLVPPRRWQGVILADVDKSNTKQAAAIVAARLFPNVDLRVSARAKKADSGLVDALLIAEYARRTM